MALVHSFSSPKYRFGCKYKVLEMSGPEILVLSLARAVSSLLLVYCLKSIFKEILAEILLPSSVIIKLEKDKYSGCF